MSDDRGAVTAELAIAMIAVVGLLLLVLSVGVATAARVRCTDAARTAARSAALGADDAAVRAAAVRAGGAGATARVGHDGDWVTVTVSVPIAGGPFSGLHAGATATTRVEP